MTGKEVHRSAGEIAMEGEMDREKRIREVTPLADSLYMHPKSYSVYTITHTLHIYTLGPALCIR